MILICHLAWENFRNHKHYLICQSLRPYNKKKKDGLWWFLKWHLTWPKGTEFEFDVLQPWISHQLMHCNKSLRPSLKANASKTMLVYRLLYQFMKVPAYSIWCFLKAPIDVHTEGFSVTFWYDHNILYRIAFSVLSKVSKSKMVFYFILLTKNIHIWTQCCMLLYDLWVTLKIIHDVSARPRQKYQMTTYYMIKYHLLRTDDH